MSQAISNEKAAEVLSLLENTQNTTENELVSAKNALNTLITYYGKVDFTSEPKMEKSFLKTTNTVSKKVRRLERQVKDIKNTIKTMKFSIKALEKWKELKVREFEKIREFIEKTHESLFGIREDIIKGQKKSLDTDKIIHELIIRIEQAEFGLVNVKVENQELRDEVRKHEESALTRRVGRVIKTVARKSLEILPFVK